MTEVRIRLRPDGPLVVEGPVTLLDHEGRPFTLPTAKANLALCRCGASADKPFCDGSHKHRGFQSQPLAGEAG